jgi:hypothetical protein
MEVSLKFSFSDNLYVLGLQINTDILNPVFLMLSLLIFVTIMDFKDADNPTQLMDTIHSNITFEAGN